MIDERTQALTDAVESARRHRKELQAAVETSERHLLGMKARLESAWVTEEALEKHLDEQLSRSYSEGERQTAP